VVTLTAGITFFAFDSANTMISTGSGAHRALAFTVTCLTTAPACFPISCALCMRLCGCCLHLTRFKHVAFTSCVSAATSCGIIFDVVSLRFLVVRGLFVVIYLVATCLCLLTFVVFRRAPGRQRRRRVSGCSKPWKSWRRRLHTPASVDTVGDPPTDQL